MYSHGIFSVGCAIMVMDDMAKLIQGVILMISNFFVAVNAVVPLFCLIFIGTLVRRFKLIDRCGA